MDCSMPAFPVHPEACSNSCPSSWWCHPTILSSVILFSSCPQSFPASGYFPVSRLFASGAQSIGVSASASFLPKKSQGWSPSEWTGWISLQSKGLSRVFSSTMIRKHKFFSAQPSLWSSSHPYIATGRVFLVVDFFPFVTLNISWPAEFLLKNQLITL